MSGGRVPVRGGMARGELSKHREIGLRSLEQYRSDKADDLDYRKARHAHKQIRDCVNIYRLAHGGAKGTGPQTRTQIVEAVKIVKKNAAGVVRFGCKENWLDRLDDALSVNVTLLVDLHKAIRDGLIDAVLVVARAVTVELGLHRIVGGRWLDSVLLELVLLIGTPQEI